MYANLSVCMILYDDITNTLQMSYVAYTSRVKCVKRLVNFYFYMTERLDGGLITSI